MNEKNKKTFGQTTVILLECQYRKQVEESVVARTTSKIAALPSRRPPLDVFI